MIFAVKPSVDFQATYMLKSYNIYLTVQLCCHKKSPDHLNVIFFDFFLWVYITVYPSSSLLRSSIKSFSDNWPGQPQSSHPPGRMKENDIKIKWERPLGVRMAGRWRNPSQAQDSPDVFSPEEAPRRRLTLSTTPPRHSVQYQTFTPSSLLERNKVTDIQAVTAVLGKGLSR